MNSYGNFETPKKGLSGGLKAIVAVIIVFVCGIIAGLTFEIIYFMFIGLVIVNFLASSLNSLITSIFPMFMRTAVNSGKFAGILNGFCYLGSTVSSYGLGAVADNYGWSAVFGCMFGACVLIALVCGVYMIFERCRGGNTDG